MLCTKINIYLDHKIKSTRISMLFTNISNCFYFLFSQISKILSRLDDCKYKNKWRWPNTHFSCLSTAAPLRGTARNIHIRHVPLGSSVEISCSCSDAKAVVILYQISRGYFYQVKPREGEVALHGQTFTLHNITKKRSGSYTCRCTVLKPRPQQTRFSAGSIYVYALSSGKAKQPPYFASHKEGGSLSLNF